MSLLSVAMLLPSCGRTKKADKGAEKEVEVEEVTEAGKTIEIDPKFKVAAQVLGHGYDVTGSYATTFDIKDAVLDFATLFANDMVRHEAIEKSDIKTYEGITSEEYASELEQRAGVNVSAGMEGIFSFHSEIKNNFQRAQYNKDSYAFSTRSSIYKKNGFFIKERTDIDRLLPYLSAAFVEDLKNLDSKQLIERYGTHVMLGGIWGARLDRHMSVKRRIASYNTSSGTDISVSGSGTYKNVTAGGGVSTSSSNANNNYFDESTANIYTASYGGKSQYAQGVHDTVDFDKWLETIEDLQVWCEYYPNKGLVPIYMFAEKVKDREKLEEAYNEHIKNQAVKLTSAYKDAVATASFELTGGTKLNGDGEINTQKGKTIKYDLSVDISRKGSNIVAGFNFYIDEYKEDSKFRMTGTHEIAVNKQDFIITEKNLAWSTGSQSFTGQKHGWRPISEVLPFTVSDCSFMPKNSLYLRFDESGRNDHEIMGVKGKLTVKYAYIE